MQWIRVRAECFAGTQLTSAPESISMSTDSHSRASGATHGTDLLICVPGLKGHFTHAANIEVASDRCNHDCVLAASLTRSGATEWTFFLGHCDDMCPLSPQFQQVLTAFAPLASFFRLPVMCGSKPHEQRNPNFREQEVFLQRRFFQRRRDVHELQSTFIQKPRQGKGDHGENASRNRWLPEIFRGRIFFLGWMTEIDTISGEHESYQQWP